MFIKHTKNKILDFLAKIFWAKHSFAHFLWATWAIRSQLLICLDQSEQITRSRSFDLSEMSKWANERWEMSKFPALQKFYDSMLFVIPWLKSEKCCLQGSILQYTLWWTKETSEHNSFSFSLHSFTGMCFFSTHHLISLFILL